MARVNNARGGPGDEDPRPPPRLTAQEKGKVKKTTTKERNLVDVETEREQQQWQSPLSEQREVELGVVSILPISYHQLRGLPSRGLRVIMVVQLGLP